MLILIPLVLALAGLTQPGADPAGPAQPQPPGQSPARTPGPAAADGRPIHDAAVAAAEKLKGVSYTADLRATGALAAGLSPARGRVVILKGGSEFEQIPARFLIDAEVSDSDSPEPKKVVLGFDGKQMTLIRHSARQYRRADVKDDPMLMSVYDPAMNLLVFNYVERGAWGEASEIVAVSVAGREDVAGVPCDVVAVEHALDPEGGPAPAEGEAGPGPTTITVREFIGAEDRLLRRIEFPLSMPGDGVEGEPSVLTITLSDLKADPEVDPAIFTPAVPEGYTETPTPEMPEMAGPGLQAGDQAPAWTLTDPEGKSHSLADYSGRVVLIDFWATWCGPCRAAMPGVQQLHERFKDRGVVVLGLNLGEDEDADPVGYMKKQGFTYGLLLNSEAAAEAYGVMSIPHFFVIGVDGKIIHTSVGFDEQEGEVIAGVIEAHLKEHGK